MPIQTKTSVTHGLVTGLLFTRMRRTLTQPNVSIQTKTSLTQVRLRRRDQAVAHGRHRHHSHVPAGPGAAVAVPGAGVLVAHVPWALPGAKCMYLLEDT